ncbi:MAG: TIGR04190 family B12-binding domain/radical SAM domain protein [Syntrophobacterales bacterium]|nr:MAG: TIGR04190 family B12-binding domain/radical SAM domain protein [Syntrophobacterales bacterium]
MGKIDLILLHPPTLYDFRKEPVMYGPISDVVPSTPIFEMYPIGFASLSEYLERNGLHVRIINVALKMLKSKDFDVPKMIHRLRPIAFGLDLHWMAHVQGCLALAEEIKRVHPRIPVILGGLSATYYHEEILRDYPQVDFIIKGDSTEVPLLELIRCLKEKRDISHIPNLTWRNERGRIHSNPITYVPETLDDIAIDYRHIMQKVWRYRDPTGYEPFTHWFTYPVTAVFTCRGCRYNCKICGGSANTFHKMTNRQRPAYRDPLLLARDIMDIRNHLRAPIMIIGDIFQPGDVYGFKLLSALKGKGIKNHIAFEFFALPSREKLERISEAIPNFNLEISPESHDVAVRKAFGRLYDNDALEAMVRNALDLGCRRIDLFFMTGLPQQTRQSVLDTVDYCRYLLERYGKRRRLLPFISPLAPFLDPGSPAFENPERYGYRLFYRSVEEHRMAMLSPSWKYTLNYETEWMTRDEIVYGTYEAALRLNRLKGEFGLIDTKTALATEKRIKDAVKLMRRIDEVAHIDDQTRRNRELTKLGLHINKLNMSTVCEKRELEWPLHWISMNPLRVFKTLFMRLQSNVLEGE